MNDNREPRGGFKPGDVVSVRGVVRMIHPEGGDLRVELGPAVLAFIERPAPPEPDWQPGDLAEDERGERYIYADPDDRSPWIQVWQKGNSVAGASWYSRDGILGPLHRLTVTREDEGQ
jgi:hypothetical protein